MRTAPVLTRPAPPPSWVGDPLILVYAVRHALTVRGGHVPRFVEQSISANARLLSMASRRVIVRDIREWLNDETNHAPADERAVWISALAALGVEA